MINLFIDTSDKDVSIGIIKDNILINKVTESIPNSHSIYTTYFIKELLDSSKLQPNDIDRILVVSGPGSFTGIRIGVTIAKVYAYLLKKEIISISSLKILAISSKEKNNYYLSLIDAKHDNYYIGLYNENYDEVIAESFSNLEEVKYLIDKYNPTILSNNDLSILNYNINKTILDLPKIIEYYKDKKTENPHLVNPNYLKLPQALEK
jgi:tRNA threonylcarbamoyladenosine biosynthesis protein TsaB